MVDTDSAGVSAVGSEMRSGMAGTGGVAEVNELEITQAGEAPSTVEVTFKVEPYGVSEKATVVLEGTETTAEIASKIAAARQALHDGKGINRQSINVADSTVTFTSTKPVADKNVTITLTKK